MKRTSTPVHPRTRLTIAWERYLPAPATNVAVAGGLLHAITEQED